VLKAERAAGAPRRDLLVVDVFSGDAVPAHLFTVEAFDLYFERLQPHGLLALHVSNRHLKLGRVALGIAASRGWPAVVLVSRSQGFATAATWVVVARDEADLRVVRVGDVFRDVRRTVDDPVVWTDDFHSILHALKD
jgi:spermidine synthase